MYVGRTPLSHGQTTPRTPRAITHRATLTVASGSSSRERSPSAERASELHGSQGPRKDTRPIGDKGYQSTMLRLIDDYIRRIGHIAMLNNNGSLKPITLKMFVEVSDLLVKLLDIKQNVTLANYIEELPKIAKKLNYPGVVNKSWLKTANTMHSWPQVLGWLSWLVEVLTLQDLADDEFKLESLPFFNADRQGECHATTLSFVLEAYGAWNDEKLDEEKACAERYLETVAAEVGVREEDLARARAELGAAEANLQAEEEKDRLADEEERELDEILMSLQEDERKQEAYLKEKEKYIAGVRAQTEQMNGDYGVMCNEVQNQRMRQKELKEQIGKQTMSVAERDKILEKCAGLQTFLHTFDDHLDELDKEKYTLDMKLTNFKMQLDKVIFAYNKDIIIHLHESEELAVLKLPETGLMSPAIVEEMEASLGTMNSLSENLKKKIAEKDSSIEANQEKLQALKEKIATMNEENQNFVAMLNEKKKRINEIKAEAKAEETRLKEAIKTLKNNMKQMRMTAPNVQKASDELAEAKDKMEAVRRKKEFLEERAQGFFDKMFGILGDHRNQLAAALTNHNQQKNQNQKRKPDKQ